MKTSYPDASKIGAPCAGLLAWVVLACINAAVIAFAFEPVGVSGLRVRLLHHLYDFGHMLALGLTSWAALWLWHRWGPRRRIWSHAALFACATAVSLLLFSDDLAGFLQRRASQGGQRLWYVIACASAGAGIALFAALATALSRPYLRWAALLGGLCLGVANHVVLQLNYPAVHLWWAWCAALLLAGFVRTVPAPRPFPAARAWLRVALLAFAAAGSAVTVIWSPNNTVWKELFRTSGSVLAPMLAKAAPTRREVPLLIEGSPWFRARGALPAVAPSQPPLLAGDPIVLLITVDALRADVVANGKHADQLPAIEALRKESLEFSMARAPSPSTVTTFMSMVTGKYYSGMYWSELQSEGKFKGAIMAHEDSSVRMPALLTGAGVTTVHVLSLYGLGDAVTGPNGFSEEIPAARDYGRAANVMELILERLRKHREGPLFLYVHFVDPHAPYNLGGTEGTPYERYLREVALVDAQLARLRSFIEKWPARERTLLMLSADHGEAFGEHNSNQHAVVVYEEVMRVPLLVWGANVKRRVVDEPVSLIDLGPTVLDLYRQPTPAAFLGESLVPFLRGETPKLGRPIAAEGGRRLQTLYFDSGLKAIVDLKRNTREVYDLRSDPAEKANLVDLDPQRSSYALRATQAFFDAHALHRDGYVPPWRLF